MLKRCAFVLLIAACGGGSQKPAPLKATGMGPGDAATTGLSECAVLAGHTAEVVSTFKDPPPVSKDVMAQVVQSHCETDGWSTDAKKCFNSFKDEDSAKTCAKMLTEDQHDKVMKDVHSKAPKVQRPDAASTRNDDNETDDAAGGRGKAAKPPPPPSAPARARAPASPTAPSKSKGPVKGDPCDGGE